ncbi:hypothetical protein [Lactobacillus ultunensis]|uniref:Uncharacterized protein n=1 Tax=Lactobacillus ultunensis DSM 16047 TaxID=525365 RepID=C2ENL2_9LACO|nr:hypothetical protein [Lactobacillus ultunensis]EEJ71883.1 hypothetical protein HMPREF0548_1258 [Lactobacillus ultunensis DSM 16047]QQP27592.1 hypothetical protein H4B44_05440 [Lactobacillus ultunensis]
MPKKLTFYRIMWYVVFFIWALLMLFWHTNAAAGKVFMMIYTLVILIWGIVIILQIRKHKTNHS